MGYFKLYYALLNLKKVVIFAYFNVKIFIEFELFNAISLCILSIRFFD
jgi:hypothetical protein